MIVMLNFSAYFFSQQRRTAVWLLVLDPEDGWHYPHHRPHTSAQSSLHWRQLPNLHIAQESMQHHNYN